jgi:uncharacterized protein (UPF0333 family)
MIDKKGDIELGWQFLFSFLFALLIFGMMMWFVAKQGKGDLMQEQIIAKEVCLLATNARSGSTIEVEHAKNMMIERKDSGIIVKSYENSPGYFYPCYLKEADFTKKDNKTYIDIK